jgi:hypothetical protein
MNSMAYYFNEQKGTLQCLDNKICNVRAEIPVAIATNIEPVRSEVRKIQDVQKQQAAEQAQQANVLAKQGRDIAHLFDFVRKIDPSLVPSRQSEPPAPRASPHSTSPRYNVPSAAPRVFEQRPLEHCPRPAAPVSIVDRVRDAVAHVAKLIREADAKRNTVFLRRSNAAADDFVLGVSDVEDLLSEFAVQDHIVQVRGKAGYSITFYSAGFQTGPDNASRFVDFVAKKNTNIWCVIERPQELRELQGRAHDFGGAFKKYCATTGRRVNTFYALHAEFLIIGEIVVAPISLLPATTAWQSVFRAICDVLEAGPEKVNYRQPLQAQLWEHILTVVCEAADRVELNTINSSFKAGSSLPEPSSMLQSASALTSSASDLTSSRPPSRVVPAVEAGLVDGNEKHKADAQAGGANGNKRRKLSGNGDSRHVSESHEDLQSDDDMDYGDANGVIDDDSASQHSPVT